MAVGKTLMVMVRIPKPAMRSFIWAVAPLTREIVATTAATPITIPKMESPVRKRCELNALKALRKRSAKTMAFLLD
jgi:hypothetical protein